MASALLLAVLLAIWFFVIPYPRGLDDENPERTALMEQRIEEARAAGTPYEIRQEWVSLAQISPELVRAVLVAEDHRFRQHRGVDWQALAEEVQWTGDDDFQWWSPSDLAALARAVGYVWSNRDELRGRSTITQQLAKNLYFGTERSFLRKAMELVVARRLERHMDKDRILELYLNVAELGPGIFGVEAASQAYFGRSAARVDPGGAAELAATLPHPLTSNPARNPRRMLWRKELILRRLAAPPGEPPAPLPLPDFDVDPADLEVPGGGLPEPEPPDTAASAPRPLPPGDSLRPDTVDRQSGEAADVRKVAERIEGCRAGCAGIVYLWSHRMPLSRVGRHVVERAAEELGVERVFLESETLASFAHGEAIPASRMPGTGTGRAVLASGALGHAPALVVYAEGRVLGPAIYGYKTAPAYVSAIRRRLERRGPGTNEGTVEGRAGRTSGAGSGAGSTVHDPASAGGVPGATWAQARVQTVAEFEAVGRPGAYFRWVPGREAIAYESGGRIYLLDLGDGRSREAPGYVDFVPAPDGRFFVTPAPRRSGMAFYDANEVFRAADAGEPGRVGPFHTDPAMRDQYPSVGILRRGDDPDRSGSETRFRVLTSWFEGISYRDYRLTDGDRDDAGGRTRVADPEMTVEPLGDPVQPCRDRQLSIPIMSQSGREVAARDESTGTTKIYRILQGGRCDEVLDLGVQTGKVAWHWSGRLLAFARPPETRRIGPGGLFQGLRPRGGGTNPGDGDAQAPDGIFLFDRDEERLWRVPGSEDASALAFPEFIGGDRLVYLVPGSSGEASVFRVVEGSW